MEIRVVRLQSRDGMIVTERDVSGQLNGAIDEAGDRLGAIGDEATSIALGGHIHIPAAGLCSPGKTLALRARTKYMDP